MVLQHALQQTLQHTATRTATHHNTITLCKTLQDKYSAAQGNGVGDGIRIKLTNTHTQAREAMEAAHCNILQHILQHTAAHTATHTATRTATDCNILQHTAAPCCIALSNAHMQVREAMEVAHCNTLQHTLQHALQRTVARNTTRTATY